MKAKDGKKRPPEGMNITVRSGGQYRREADGTPLEPENGFSSPDDATGNKTSVNRKEGTDDAHT